MMWLVVWVILAALMASLLIVLSPPLVVFGLCFLAWCGGVVSAVVMQRLFHRR